MNSNAAPYSPNWLPIAHASTTQSLPITTAYATLGTIGLQHSLLATASTAIYTDTHLFPHLIEPLKSTNAIRIVIHDDDESPASLSNITQLRAAHPGLQILSFQGLVELGMQHPVEFVPPAPDDLCSIMYTSGSTGAPKGTPIRHRAVVAAGT